MGVESGGDVLVAKTVGSVDEMLVALVCEENWWSGVSLSLHGHLRPSTVDTNDPTWEHLPSALSHFDTHSIGISLGIGDVPPVLDNLCLGKSYERQSRK